MDYQLERDPCSQSVLAPDSTLKDEMLFERK